MSILPIERAHASRASFGETLGYQAVASSVFAVALVGLALTRLTGRKSEIGLWREARGAAHAIAGYAFKY